MGPAFGYLSNDFSLAQSAFYRVRDSLRAGAIEGVASWGIGFVQDGQVLLRKRLHASTEGIDLTPAIGELRSDCILGWIGVAEAAWSGVDIPPYRYRNWLLSHFGELDAASPTLAELKEQVPSFVALKGKGPSEVLVSLVLEQLRRAEKRVHLDHQPREAAKAVATAICHIRECARACGAENPPVQNYMLTDGTLLVASSSGAPLLIHTIDGILDDPVLRQQPVGGRPEKHVDHPSFKAQFVASGLENPDSSWRTLPPDSVTVIDSQLTQHTYAIAELIPPDGEG